MFYREGANFGVFKMLGCVVAPSLPPHALGRRLVRVGPNTFRQQVGGAAVAVSHEHILAAAVWAATRTIGLIRVLVPPAVGYYHPNAV